MRYSASASACLLILTLIRPGSIDAQPPQPDPDVKRGTVQKDPTKLPREAVFRQADLDRNGTVSRSELFRHKLAADANPAARRAHLIQKLQFESAFGLADGDSNEELTLAEFQANAWGAEAFRAGTTNTRGRIPDPMLAVIARLGQVIPGIVSQLDQNGDEQLDQAEWASVNWPDLLPLAASPLDWWDKDKNGTVSSEEWIQGLQVAFCQQDSNGIPLRDDEGAFFNLNYFNAMDANRDGWLTREEFKARYYQGPEKSGERFDQVDPKMKGKLTFAEMRGVFRISVLDAFVNYDVNLDGLISHDELLAKSRPDQRIGAERVFPGFDGNGDGLSLVEFQLSSLADESVGWNNLPNDADRDGMLTPAEFRPGKTLLASGLSDSVFRTLDRNHDGTLSYDECRFTTDPTKLPREVVFQQADLDHNGTVSRAEIFRHKLATDANAGARRSYLAQKLQFDAAFALADADANDELTLAEFQADTWGVEAFRAGTSTARVRQPDPILDLIARLSQAIPVVVKRHDTNSNGQLDAAEWAQLNWTDLQPLAPSPIEWWDKDKNSAITSDEWIQGLQVAFCQQAPEGTPLRRDDGSIFNFSYFTSLDANRDGWLTREEFTTRYYQGPEKSGERFDQIDTASNGKLTFAQMHVVQFRTPVLDAFLNCDVNLDGLVTRDELFAKCRPDHRAVAERTFPAFDQDGDGLTLMEYRATPFADETISWISVPNDADRDGVLTPAEFRPSKTLLASGLSDSYFRTLDRNHNGTLSYDECRFTTDPTKLPREVVFQQADLDHNGTVSRAEIFRHKLATDANAGARRSYLAQKLQFDAAFALADADANDELTLAEFQADTWGVEAFRAGTSTARVRLPDPILDLIARLSQAIPVVVKRHDTNSDGQLDAAEWAQVNWTDLQPLAPSPIEWWDKDKNSAISPDEWIEGLQVAFCQQAPNGTPLRRDDGTFFNYYYFTMMDADLDGSLTREEFSAKYYQGPEKSGERFDQVNAEKKGKLSFAEMQPVFRASALDWFLNYDVNLDGLVTHDELLARCRPDQRMNAERLYPGFDPAGDGLSLMEFRATPLADESVGWNNLPNDADRDGVLTPAEFRPGKTLLASALSDTFFRSLDLNHNGNISYDECPYSTDMGKLPRDLVFRMKDANADGHLAFDEVFKDKRPDADNVNSLRGYLNKLMRCQMAFQVTDADRNNVLSMDEFQRSEFAGTCLSESYGGPIPDPIRNLVDAAVESVFKPNVDSLSRSAWNSLKWESLSPDLADLAGTNADQNRDGTVSRDELRHLVEVAYGVCLSDGTPIRVPTGQFFNYPYFVALDADHNGKLSRSEFVTRHYSGPETAARLFDAADVDRDGMASIAELMPSMRSDRVGMFLNFDKNLDGRITPEELAERAQKWEQIIAMSLFPAFDEDNDGSLTFEEFELCPFPNRVLEWNRVRRDANFDALLSYREFRLDGEKLFASALNRRFFRLLDRNHDGSLSYNEFQFDMDLSKVSAEVAFQMQDKDHNNKLSFSEVFRDPKPATDDKDAIERYEMRLGAAETRFLADDVDRDGSLSVDEFQRSKDAALAAVERKTKALTRHRGRQASNLPFTLFLILDGMVLATAAWFVFKWSNGRKAR
ncbi:MAG: EF-hand domain-containing protein [Planctomycetes bacterium]|nr:EF-hand domain-containing protein [Planctomycetota bacterium]